MSDFKCSLSAYRAAQDYEEMARLCWQLVDLLSVHFVGYEDDIKRLHSLAFDFDKAFRDIVGYEG